MQVPYHSTDMCVDLAACMATGQLMLISYHTNTFYHYLTLVAVICQV